MATYKKLHTSCIFKLFAMPSFYIDVQIYTCGMWTHQHCLVLFMYGFSLVQLPTREIGENITQWVLPIKHCSSIPWLQDFSFPSEFASTGKPSSRKKIQNPVTEAGNGTAMESAVRRKWQRSTQRSGSVIKRKDRFRESWKLYTKIWIFFGMFHKITNQKKGGGFKEGRRRGRSTDVFLYGLIDELWFVL